MIIELDMNSSIPIYVQLRNQIVMGIGHGELKPGESLPTVRQLAEDAGVKDILIPSKNESDYLELDEEITSGVNIHLVEDMRQVLDLALVR